MVISGYDYKFLYSVGAFLGIQALKLSDQPKDGAEKIRTIFSMAILLNKEYEDAMRLDDPEYKVNYLKPEVLRTLSLVDFHKLTAEVNEAIAVGQGRTVEAEPLKKTEAGADSV